VGPGVDGVPLLSCMEGDSAGGAAPSPPMQERPEGRPRSGGRLLLVRSGRPTPRLGDAACVHKRRSASRVWEMTAAGVAGILSFGDSAPGARSVRLVGVQLHGGVL
jgi:hypothetical protein